MALGVKIDFDNIYEVTPVIENLNESFFETELVDGTRTNLHVEIDNRPHTLRENLYNLAFGPLNKKGQIDDRAQLTHSDYAKVFSTILFEAKNYLLRNPDHQIGIDGSTNGRAYLYFRFFKKNYDYLSNYFDIYCVKYYVRIARIGEEQYEDPFDFGDVMLYEEKLEKKTKNNPKFMYNYFIFKLK
ncbi:hypothetical protein SAMN05428988_5897 [Chitinophaga sp. YR573]|uniref:DUF6934 family protein n=1 Tax=Chitinophaga sp. YR573 TaxID=1881040 RepID=UPI0008CFB9C9|nr:hypothetical protein [Chitinophaga sp. YR573]SEW44936.1 hypothetical protein SAMN05428988_5897 [Chitinophaga sp. YR573]